MFYAQFESETTDNITINVTVIRGFTLAQIPTLQSGVDFFGNQPTDPGIVLGGTGFVLATAGIVTAKDLFRLIPRTVSAGTVLGSYTFPQTVTLCDVALKDYGWHTMNGCNDGDPAKIMLKGATLHYAKSPEVAPETPSAILVPHSTGADTPGTLYIAPLEWWNDYWYTVGERRFGSPFSDDLYSTFEVNFSWVWSGTSEHPGIFSSPGTYNPLTGWFTSTLGTTPSIYNCAAPGSRWTTHSWMANDVLWTVEYVEVGIKTVSSILPTRWIPSPPPLSKKKSGIIPILAGVWLLAATALMAAPSPSRGRARKNVR